METTVEMPKTISDTAIAMMFCHTNRSARVTRVAIGLVNQGNVSEVCRVRLNSMSNCTDSGNWLIPCHVWGERKLPALDSSLELIAPADRSKQLSLVEGRLPGQHPGLKGRACSGAMLIPKKISEYLPLLDAWRAKCLGRSEPGVARLGGPEVRIVPRLRYAERPS